MGRRSFTQILVLLRILFRFSIDFLCGALSISRVRAVGGEAGVSASKTKKFDRIHIAETLARHFPFGPQEHLKVVEEWVAQRDWPRKTRIVTAVSIGVNTHIRHSLTEYEQFLNVHKLTREEARQIVRDDVWDIFLTWHKGAGAQLTSLKADKVEASSGVSHHASSAD